MANTSTTSFTSTIILNPNIITNYLGTFILVFGAMGEFLNLVVFLSLRTFRESSCAFYLTVASFFKILQIFTGLLSRVFTSITAVDWTAISPFYCKFRGYFAEFSPLCTLGLACLAVVDQYFATSTHPRWQRWCDIKVAYRLSFLMTTFSSIGAIPHGIFFELVESPITKRYACILNNKAFDYYNTNVNLPLFFGPLQILITIIFAILTYRHVKQIAYRTVPLVRRRLDQQLTTMVLTQTVFNSFAIIPYVVMVLIVNHTTLLTDASTGNVTLFVLTTIAITYYLYPTSSFYIYMCTSERFRQQLRYVLFDIHFNRWLRRKINPVNNIA
ncbi:unnamed protein product [Adineta ricciae]|uniref:G-protein coupled receptors family 1 profile domain-containing protein n=1 Tax=Adineta ricciae TaxID=249248 RepID=A0A815QAC6_ADIRI|nr:unnamed protein product [Adineta ricciae]CAF1460566.1 unnamed protein product [Adineta ricciae]